jgi:alcohol dehydrogenase (NADP+)
MIATVGYAALKAGAELTAIRFERREAGPSDVVIRLLWCGVCHSDLHMSENDWGFTPFPLVPGHEMVGEVLQVGADVKKLRPGDTAAVGCMIDSCRRCAHCEAGLEQYCDETPTSSFGSFERGTRNPIFGGFSSHYVVDERFALKVPASLDPARAAPLLCAGITAFSPLRHWNVGPGTRVGVVGIGGVGHLAVKLAQAMGAEVTAITSSTEKGADAVKFGAQQVLLSNDEAALKANSGALDLIVDTVSGDHDVATLIDLLHMDGTLCVLGIPRQPLSIPALSLQTKRRRIAGSIMGGIAETQEMLGFCARHNVAAEVEVVPAAQVNNALTRLKRNDVRYRFVLEMSSLAG